MCAEQGRQSSALRLFSQPEPGEALERKPGARPWGAWEAEQRAGVTLR